MAACVQAQQMSSVCSKSVITFVLIESLCLSDVIVFVSLVRPILNYAQNAAVPNLTLIQALHFVHKM